MITPFDSVQNGSTLPVAIKKSVPAADSGFHAVFEQKVHTALTGGADVPNNSTQFATADAAAALAKKLGGTVQENSLAGQFSRSAPERMITGAGANPINAGLALDLFAKFGDAPGSEAWKVIDRDLGRG